jgi:hypothetical protein
MSLVSDDEDACGGFDDVDGPVHASLSVWGFFTGRLAGKHLDWLGSGGSMRMGVCLAVASLLFPYRPRR